MAPSSLAPPLTRFGLQIPSFTYPGVADHDLFSRVAAIARAAEESGFDSVWVMDHLYQIRGVGPPTDPMLEAYTLLAGIAARTERARLGTLVTGVTYRNPALLAKIVTTLDVVSSGRAILGIGAAWNEDEHRGYGFPFPPVRERMDRLEEALLVCRAMFTDAAPSYQGRYYSTSEVLNNPRPVNGTIPILIGGGGEQRTLRLVAQYADGCNLFGDQAMVRHKLDVLERHCEAVGRDPAEITKTRLGTIVVDDARAGEAQTEQWCEEAQAFFDLGLDGLIYNLRTGGDLDAVRLVGETLTKTLG